MQTLAHILPAPGKPPARPPLRKISLEEHFNHPAVLNPAGPPDAAATLASDIEAYAHMLGLEPAWFRAVHERLFEFGEKRLTAMDSGHIDVSILSLTTPGVQGIPDGGRATAAAREINDFLARKICDDLQIKRPRAHNL